MRGVFWLIAIAVVVGLLSGCPHATAAEEGVQNGEQTTAVPSVALLPLHCRAADRHARLATAIALVAADKITQMNGLLIVDRERIDAVFQEKHMSAADLTDNGEK